MPCVRCRELDARIGSLCARCAELLAGDAPICPEQIVSHVGHPSDGALVDQWGRVHVLGERTTLGRSPGAGGIGVAEPSVSRSHAVFERKDGAFIVRDLESSNGTRCNGMRVDAVTLRHGDVVYVGQIGLAFVSPPPAVAAPVLVETLAPPPPSAGLVQIEYDEDASELGESETFVGLREANVNLDAPTGGGAGVVTVDGATVHLPLAQYELVRLLCDRMRADRDRDERVRGFIRSGELLASLPFDTAGPSENSLKQLVRRLRKALARAGVPDLVESRHGFGYRVRVRPR